MGFFVILKLQGLFVCCVLLRSIASELHCGNEIEYFFKTSCKRKRFALFEFVSI